ncbi:MAG: helix-turn-helix domain-containing protein [Rhodoferax sp.]
MQSSTTVSPLISSFGLAVRQLRGREGLSQERLAERANLNRSYIGELERGEAIASLLTLEKLAQALNSRPSHLLSHTERIVQKRHVYGIALTSIAC